jgi:hypothetical protein
MSRRDCTEITPECPIELTLYGYRPALGVNSFFVALFSICFIVQVAYGSLRRTWTFMLALAVATFGEAIGYAGRVMMNDNPWSDAGFKMQICCLVLAPSFLAAGIYLTLKHVVLYCGPEHSRLKPRLYPWIFIGCDLGSIILQACGGGVAASAGDRGGERNQILLDAGNGLIIAGIGFQIATMTVCFLLMIDYYVRFRKAKKHLNNSDGVFSTETDWEKNRNNSKVRRNFRLFVAAVAVAFTTTLLRCVYRMPEMAGLRNGDRGWGNELMRKENEFLLLDGMMIAIACVLLTVFHPGYFFPPMRRFKK